MENKEFVCDLDIFIEERIKKNPNFKKLLEEAEKRLATKRKVNKNG